ncbi:MAG: outer membrane lipoprotein chaperone LolA [Arsenophonus sp. ET-YP4-MAG3]
MIIIKLIMLSLLVMSFYINQSSANAATELQTRLNKINSFYCIFIQKVTGINGNLIQKGEGQLWIKYPNLFKWYTISPDESLLISDGINLWFYNHLLNQVTITLLSEIMIDMPIMLITHNNQNIWKHYKISQNGNYFILKTKQNKGNIKYISITIQPNGTIQHFSTIEKNGQTSSYYFKKKKNNHINKNIFKFISPKNVTIDDQRPKRLTR